LIETAARYATSADGDIPAEAMPASLRDKISLRIGPINAG
jgi:predicted metal-binding protein